jgi:hypothetical protein
MASLTPPVPAGARTYPTLEQFALIVAFLSIIAMPLASNLASRVTANPAENSEVASMPPIGRTVRSVVQFPSEFGHWFDSHFGFRARLIRWYGVSRLFGLRVSPSARVIKGQDGWFFLASEGGVEDYANHTPMPSRRLDAWRDMIVGTNAWLRSKRIAYVFTIAPDKHVIYPEEMPPSIHQLGATSRTDQVFAVLSMTDVPAIDVRPALLRGKARERLYQKTDTHWNDRGAFIAYQQILDAVRRQVPAVPPAWSRDDFEASEQVTPGQDLARMMGLMLDLHETDLGLLPRRSRQARVVDPPGASLDGEQPRIVTEIPGSSLPRAVVLRDSFTSKLAPFLSEHFSRVVYLWQRDIDEDLVRKEHPDVVIQEVVGRFLSMFTPTPPTLPR